MSETSRQDLKTILLNAIHLAKVDNDLHFMEKKILKRFSDAIHLADEEREELIEMAGSLSANIESLTSDYAKQLLIKTLCAVSHVDGNSGREELDFIEKVVKKLGGGFQPPPLGEWGGCEDEIFVMLEQEA